VGVDVEVDVEVDVDDTDVEFVSLFEGRSDDVRLEYWV